MKAPSRTKNFKFNPGQRLREARERANIAQETLGVLAGLEESSSSARMSRYETGVHAPPLHFIESISKVLGISAAYFYCSDDRLAEIILAYSSLPEEGRESLREVVAKLSS